MKTITTTVYEFDELTDKAKEKARDWYREFPLDADFVWDTVLENAREIGLKIISLDQHRANEGSFVASAEETAHKIEANHGESCETFTTAKAYLKARDEVINTAEKDENGDFVSEYDLDNKLDELDTEFLHNLLEDYQCMLEKDFEYLNSDESVDDNIRANEYTFTIDGKREG